jgi:hypothetical protein
MAYTTINKGSSYFNIILYTGTGASLANTGVGFQPDWVWIKSRSAGTRHGLYDAVRGVQKQLESDDGSAETTETTGLTAFDADGFTVGSLAQLNTSGATYVAWNWLGANTTVSNTSGNITSTVSANITAGFSIVSYTGTGANATVGHGLGVVPRMIIVRNRTTGATNWRVYHASLGATQFLTLDTNIAAATNIGAWNDTTPTSSVFTVGNSSNTNGSTNALIAYCFAEVKGYSKINSYTGNNSTDGPFVYTGFKPAFILIKSSSSSRSWVIFDNKLNPNNLSSQQLFPDAPNAETTGTGNIIDILSNGFKMRGAGAFVNDLNVIYNYMAFAENPFVTSTEVPVTAR